MDMKLRKINSMFGMDADGDEDVSFSYPEMLNTIADLRREADLVREALAAQEVGPSRVR